VKDPLSVRYLDAGFYPAWSRLVASSPQGMIYSTPEYLDVLCAAAGGRFRMLGALRGEELVGGVALYEASSPFGISVSNRLLLYFNSLVLREYDTRYPSQRTARQLEILACLEEFLSRTRYARLRLHNHWSLIELRPFIAHGWTVRPSYTYLVPLTDLKDLWSRIDKNLHRLIERCTQHQVTVSADDDFEALYRLHRETHDRKASPLYLPHAAFRRYFEGLKSQNLCGLFTARLPDGRAVASQLVLLGNHPASHTVCAGADPEFMNLGTTPFLRWRVFEELAKLGYVVNDLTDAALNPVTKFKSQLGGNLQMNLLLSRPDRMLFSTSQQVSRFVSRGVSFVRRRLRWATEV